MNFRQFTLQATNVVIRGGVHKVKSARRQAAYRPSDGAVRALEEDQRNGELRRVRNRRQGDAHHPLHSIGNGAARKRGLFRHDFPNVKHCVVGHSTDCSRGSCAVAALPLSVRVTSVSEVRLHGVTSFRPSLVTLSWRPAAGRCGGASGRQPGASLRRSDQRSAKASRARVMPGGQGCVSTRREP